MFTTYLDEQDNSRAIWLGQDKRNNEWVFEVTVKVPGGVRHVVNRVKQRPTVSACIECALDILAHLKEGDSYSAKRGQAPE